jgi:hypothetical protein
LRSTHTWLLLGSGTTSRSILCTAVYLPSLIILVSKGVAAAMPGRAFMLREKELGEAAQAPERVGARKLIVGAELRVRRRNHQAAMIAA